MRYEFGVMEKISKVLLSLSKIQACAKNSSFYYTTGKIIDNQ